MNVTNDELSKALRTLGQEWQRQEEFEQEKARYELYETNEGDMVFKLREDAANDQPIHFICPMCLNRDKLFSFIRGRGDYKICKADGTHTFQFSNTPIRQPRHDSNWF